MKDPNPGDKAEESLSFGFCADWYGAPPAGTRVFIRTRQVRDGWGDLHLQTTAIAPHL